MPPQNKKQPATAADINELRGAASAPMDELRAAVGGGAPGPNVRPEAQQTGAMQRTAGGKIFTPKDIRALMNDKLLREGRYQEFAQLKEDDPERKKAEAEGMRFGMSVAAPGMRPAQAIKGFLGGTLGVPVGAALGRYAAGPRYGDIGAGFGGLIGGLYGGYKGMEGGEMPQLSKIPGTLGKIGRVLSIMGGTAEGEPNAVAGTAREMAGGTAATAMPGAAAETGAGATGAQAGPSAGPKSASELSSVVQRTRAGTAPGTAASPIVTPQQAAQETQQFTQNQAQARAQGMANAARNPEAPGSATAIPARFTSPEYTPRPSTPTLASTTEAGFSGLQPSPSPQPPGEQGGGTIDLSPTGILAMLRKRLGQARQQP